MSSNDLLHVEVRERVSRQCEFLFPKWNNNSWQSSSDYLVSTYSFAKQRLPSTSRYSAKDMRGQWRVTMIAETHLTSSCLAAVQGHKAVVGEH